MKVLGRKILVLVASIFSLSAFAADFDGSETLLCSFARVIECDAGMECRAVTNESVDAPDFVKLNFKKKQVTAISAGVENPPADFDNVDNLANYIVVQGVQGGAEGSANSLAWSATISYATGQLVLSASGENAAFVIFGACTVD